MSEFQQKISQIREDMGLSRRAFGEILGVAEAKIQKIEVGAQRADHEFLSILSEKVDVDLNWLFGKSPYSTSNEGQGSDDNFIPIRRLDVHASAGHGTLTDTETETGSYTFKREWLQRRGLNPDDLSVIAVAGDSMEPDLYNGDLIVVDHSQTVLRDSNIYAVRFSDSLFVKRIQRAPGGRILLLSKNKDYSELIVDDNSIVNDLDTANFQIIGRVVASMHEW